MQRAALGRGTWENKAEAKHSTNTLGQEYLRSDQEASRKPMWLETREWREWRGTEPKR